MGYACDTMDEQIRQLLAELIADHGRSLCTTPRVVSMMLRQTCPEASDQIQEIELALSHGCVAPMLVGLPETADVDELTRKLVDATGINEDRARGAISTWAFALSREKPATSLITRDWSQWNRLDVSHEVAGGNSTYRRSVAHLAIVAAAGAAGGSFMSVVALLTPHLRWFEFWQSTISELPSWAQVFAPIILGILGGGAGGLLGWMIGGGRSWTYDAFGGTTLGMLYFSSANAFIFANVGVLAGMAFLGLIGAMVGSLAGALLGAFLGMYAAERASRYWWW
jgi:hypothetical protein